MVVAETGKTVLTPMIGPGTGLIVGELIPRITVLAVILTDRAPLPFAEVGPPLFPWHPLLACLVETHLFRRPCAVEYGLLWHSFILLLGINYRISACFSGGCVVPIGLIFSCFIWRIRYGAAITIVGLANITPFKAIAGHFQDFGSNDRHSLRFLSRPPLRQ